MMAPFAALFEALTAYVQDDAERLRAALYAAPPQVLYGHAVRHKCGGLLFDALAGHRIRDARIGPLRSRLQHYVATCALESVESRAQVVQIVGTLRDAGVPHALLKSAAGLYAGDKIVERSQIFDLDLFVPRAQAERAVAALRANGFDYGDRALVDWYRREHHHLAPLMSPSFKRPIEVHVQLAPPGWFSTRSDWQALETHVEEICGEHGAALRLDAFGRCLHLALHGAYLRRFNDAVNVALELRRAPSLLDELLAATAKEEVQRIGLQSVLCAAARMAGIEGHFDARVQRFVDWAIQREDLPPVLRDRIQLADAWHGNGGRFRGPATALAMSRRMATLAGQLMAGMFVMIRGTARAR